MPGINQTILKAFSAPLLYMTAVWTPRKIVLPACPPDVEVIDVPGQPLPSITRQTPRPKTPPHCQSHFPLSIRPFATV